MNKSKKTIALAVAGGTLVLGAGIGAAGLAAADPPTPSASPSASASTAPSQQSAQQDGRWGQRGGRLAAKLAEKLGVPEAKVRQALQEIRQAWRSGEWRAQRPSTSPGQPRWQVREDALVKELAQKLGIDEAKVRAAVDELRAERMERRDARLSQRLDAAVKAGTLTQAEADAVTKAVEKGVIFGR